MLHNNIHLAILFVYFFRSPLYCDRYPNYLERYPRLSTAVSELLLASKKWES